MTKVCLLTVLAIITLLISCGVSKETIQKISHSNKEMTDFPINYCNLFPGQTFEEWNEDYEQYNKFLTKEIMKTQSGLSFVNNGIKTRWCPNSARPHVQLDTLTRITNPQNLIGDWRITCNRKIIYTDSATYSERKIYRDSSILYNEKDADLFIEITESKFTTYGTDGERSKFKKMNKNYEIVNQRFLLFYGTSKASASISFVGIDEQGHLIINSYSTTEREISGTYITYQTVMTQIILKKV